MLFGLDRLLLFCPRKILCELSHSRARYRCRRSPAHPLFRKVLEMVDFSIVAPSANLSTQISPTSKRDVLDAMSKNCPRMEELVILASNQLLLILLIYP